MAEEYVQVNVKLTQEDERMLDHMTNADGYDNRSAFMRRLVRQEYARRYSQPSPVTLGEAIAAGQAIHPIVDGE